MIDQVADTLAATFARLPLPNAGAELYMLLGLAIAALLVSKLAMGGRGGRRRSFRSFLVRNADWPSRFGRDTAAPARPNIADPKEQMEAISFVEFETQPLLNREEVPILLEREARSLDAGFRVMAQTSMGEILRPQGSGTTAEQRDLALRAINSKRVDFAVFDQSGTLIFAVEYQGSGHYHRTSFMRDAVKREALRKANVEFLDIHIDYLERELERFPFVVNR